MTIVHDEEELRSVEIAWTEDDSEPPVLERVVKVTRTVPDPDGTLRLYTVRIAEGDSASFDAKINNVLTQVDTLT